jgi:hypothetical protein
MPTNTIPRAIHEAMIMSILAALGLRFTGSIGKFVGCQNAQVGMSIHLARTLPAALPRVDRRQAKGRTLVRTLS